MQFGKWIYLIVKCHCSNFQGEEGSRYKLIGANTYNGAFIDKAKLEISSVDFDDAGEYKCLAKHTDWPDFNSTQILLVRVKGW